MRYLLLAFILVGCTNGYNVGIRTKEIYTYKTFFYCEKIINGSHTNLAYCDTKEECSKLCQKYHEQDNNMR
ncbi:hypothetical protein N9948_00020 [bacterium]|nr:hypothetical protein [bacterium]